MSVFMKSGTRIRVRLLGAFIIVVLISVSAVLTARLSIIHTQEKLDIIMSETLPLIANSLKLDKKAQFFALSINEFPEITTKQEHSQLINQLDQHIAEITSLIHELEQLDVKQYEIQIIKDHVVQLVSFMKEQEKLFTRFITINHQMQKAVAGLRDNHHEFITLAEPRISQSYLIFRQKGHEISAEIRDLIAEFAREDPGVGIKKIDDKLRVGFETLISSAAGEMRSNLEAVALTYLAAGVLYEAANSNDVATVEDLEEQFQAIVPQIKKMFLVLSHTTPQNHQMVITAMPIFRYGTNDPSIFFQRKEELSIRQSAATSASKALLLAEDLTTAIDIVNLNSQKLAQQSTAQLRKSLNKALAIQSVGATIAIILSIIIGWFYVEKQVLARLTALRQAMEFHSTGRHAEIPLAGDDEISDMAAALKRFVDHRSNVENRLRITVDELNAVMDSIDYGIIFTDSKLNVLLVNKAFLNIWEITENRTSETMVLADLLDTDRYKSVYNTLGEPVKEYLYNSEEMISRGEIAPVEIETIDGRFFQHQCVVLPGDARMLTYFDITEMKMNQAKLMQAQKVETIGLMAGGVAHDLNNILSGIVSYPDLLLLKLPAESDLIKPLQEIKEAGQRAAAVVADLLIVTRGTIADRKIANLNRLVSEYLTSPEAKKILTLYPEVSIQTEFSPELLNISCSPIHIKKCLMNLVLNAFEAIEQSGMITISTENRYFDKRDLQESTLPDDEYVILRIADNGPGISEKDIGNIFEPFYSKKVMGRSGTGLGLTIVWNTVQEHGGTVSVSSDQTGTTFDLYFPVTRETSDNLPESFSNIDIMGTGEKLLVVDDEPMQRSIATQILNSLRYQVETAASGEEAIELVKEKSYDLIVLDMMMSPGINGRETYEGVIAIRPEQKAVVASGFSDHDEITKIKKLGINGFIKKPYTLHEFGIAIKEFMTDSKG
ncbi:ATP-binding protein [Desulfopila sp. IMCC35008]|uniref:hybrid sensor histidine kinase/response regulator n=1 Tax=Desulfopila sp. IMCC35008 TaxID=2653858 RepID=UPI0013D79F69|nr:ATP-binding protein [Desulfopila sp. IMCC35008]